MVANSTLWAGAGLALLRSAHGWAIHLGAVQMVVVCAPEDSPMGQMLLTSGLLVASEWFAGSPHGSG